MDGQAGFTLVELLIALAVTALLSIGLYEGLRLGIHGWNSADAHASGADSLAQLRGFLQRELEQAYPAYSADDPPQAHIDFTGGPDRLSFTGPAPASLLAGGLAHIGLMAEPAADGLRLELEAQPVRDSASRTTARDELLDGVAGLSFAYFGEDRPEDAPSWHDRWEGRRVLPRLVRIRLTFPSGDPRVWPDLVVAPRLSVDAGCVFDPQLRYCRGR